MRLLKWIPALLAGMVTLALSSPAQAQFTISIVDLNNPADYITKTATSGATTTLDFNAIFADGGSKFVVTTTQYASNSGDSIVASFVTTTGTNGDTYAVTVKSSTANSNLIGVGTGAGTLTAAVTTTTFSASDTINNKATYKDTVPTTINTDSTTDAAGPSAAPTPATKSVPTVGTFTLSEVSIFGANSSGYVDHWSATASVTPVYSVPEPTGVLMGLVGLPCLGAVVFFSRRRFAGMSALAA
jgi:hypothetical protein